jgi:hypothetical protein
MVRIRKWQPDNSARAYSVCCDSTGRSGHWSCENLGPASDCRDGACEAAKDAGWLSVGGKWYCPQCQRDGFAPAPKRARPLQLQAS